MSCDVLKGGALLQVPPTRLTHQFKFTVNSRTKVELFSKSEIDIKENDLQFIQPQTKI